MPPGPRPVPLVISAAQHAVLTAMLRRSTCPQALALRAKILLVGSLLLPDETIERVAAPEPVKQRLERRGWR